MNVLSWVVNSTEALLSFIFTTLIKTVGWAYREIRKGANIYRMGQPSSDFLVDSVKSVYIC